MTQQPHNVNDAVGLSARALWGVFLLIGLTVGSLGLAWLLPDTTLLHFLWVAQVVPVLYVLLIWWGTQQIHQDDDAP
jgi:cobalamin biosynthesis protein CobD/CbiB